MVKFTKEMQRALKADAEKLSLMTSDENGVEFYNTCHACDGEGTCQVSHQFPDDPYYADVFKCETCNGVGLIRVD